MTWAVVVPGFGDFNPDHAYPVMGFEGSLALIVDSGGKVNLIGPEAYRIFQIEGKWTLLAHQQNIGRVGTDAYMPQINFNIG